MKKIAIMTYAKKEQVEFVLNQHKDSITAFAWICHDRDTTDTHCHIFIKFNSERQGSAILKWFQNCTDTKNQPCNTRFEYVKDSESLLTYFTHSECPEKAQYSESDIIYSSDKAREELLEECERGNGFEPLEDMLNNIPLRDISKKYGRDFIHHYSSYKVLYEDIKRQEKRKTEDEELLKAVMQMEQEKKEWIIKAKLLEQSKIDLETGEIKN